MITAEKLTNYKKKANAIAMLMDRQQSEIRIQIDNPEFCKQLNKRQLDALKRCANTMSSICASIEAFNITADQLIEII